MITDTSWSKLLHTDMGEYVRVAMSNPLLTYHNINHIERLYAKAKEWNLPYDCTLDATILWHDAVYDADPKKELRSAALAIKCSQDHPAWFEHIDLAEMTATILSTEEHMLNNFVSPLMIKLDLAELGDSRQRKVNFWNVVQEAKNLYQVDASTACESIFNFMTEFSKTQTNNKYRTSEMYNSAYWDSVIDGCDITALMAETVHTMSTLGIDSVN